jgi:holo-[acyl-carrier protein] synthase
VGVGLVATPRFHRALERFGERLLARVFTADEIAYAQRKRNGEHNLAARFAAKCAGRSVLRPLGVRARLCEIEVVRRRSGEPTLRLLGAPARAFPEGTLQMSLSLTHDADFAMASVWLERSER